MRKVFSSIAALGTACWALAAPHLATRDDVLAQAKHDSSEFCSLPLTRCTYSISAHDEGWTVLAVQVVKEADGRDGYPVGGHRAYIYSLDGKLQQEIPGL